MLRGAEKRKGWSKKETTEEWKGVKGGGENSGENSARERATQKEK